MRKLLFILANLCFLSNVSAQAVNWYAWIINNSSDKEVYIKSVSDRYWDNFGWAPCDTNWDWAHTSPGNVSLKCGGTTSNSVNAWLAYVITVRDKNGSTIYEKRHSWDVHNDYPANLSLKDSSWDDGGIAHEFKIQDNLDNKDGVVVYIFDDNGFSTTLLNYHTQYEYDTNERGHNLNDKKCDVPEGCTIYQRYF